MTPEQEAALAALIAAETAQYAQIETNLLEQVRAILASIAGDWWRAATTNQARRDLYEVVRAAQEAVADLTESYLDEVFGTLGIDVNAALVNAPVRLPNNLHEGIVDELTWDRPARDARVGVLLDGIDDFEAAEKALRRAEQQARMDLALARREAERQRWGVSEQIIGYRRILHPELSRTGPCGLCIIAADRIYGTGDLKPLHGGCWCTSLPVTKALDPGQTMNAADLQRYYDAAGGTGRAELQRLRVEVLEHGELGPILVDADGNALSASKAARRRDEGLDASRVVAAQKRAIARLEADLAAGRQINQQRLNQHRAWLATWTKKLPADDPARDSVAV
ncbi:MULTISPECIES: hypothetical protein [unclassified Aeromicrobium]|uniref:hypothetical protein n=1 Tax=unclassified Aeromicrobium TaxID=2633570 RepID=UPI00288B7777|nr:MULTISPECIES: hypothetical protein [unclassified Aeromicrobium]